LKDVDVLLTCESPRHLQVDESPHLLRFGDGSVWGGGWVHVPLRGEERTCFERYIAQAKSAVAAKLTVEYGEASTNEFRLIGRSAPRPPNHPHCNPSISHCLQNDTTLISLLPTATRPVPMVSAAVLTVSDTASVDHRLDNSGPSIADFLHRHGYRVLHTDIVPDDIQLIRRSITAWANGGSHPVDLIITTGGTGFGLRDVTPGL
jgi:hypothetical protein